MRRESKRIAEKVRTFHKENLYTLSYHGDSIPHLCIEVSADYERCLTIAKLWHTFHLVRVMRTNTGRDIIEEMLPVTAPIEVAAVYLAGYGMPDTAPMNCIMKEINADSDDETESDIKKFFEEVKLYLKEHEE